MDHMTATAELTEPIGLTYRRARQARGMTLEALARDAGLAYSTVVRIENGQPPRQGTRAAIERVLGITD